MENTHTSTTSIFTHINIETDAKRLYSFILKFKSGQHSKRQLYLLYAHTVFTVSFSKPAFVQARPILLSERVKQPASIKHKTIPEKLMSSWLRA